MTEANSFMSTVTPAGEETLLIVISEDTTGFGLNVIHSEVGGKDACRIELLS